ncbi:Protein of unknown function [Gryllus bimaculatus]|nr:Protein of unknown function [Gryllus bimaculatus]
MASSCHRRLDMDESFCVVAWPGLLQIVLYHLKVHPFPKGSPWSTGSDVFESQPSRREKPDADASDDDFSALNEGDEDSDDGVELRWFGQTKEQDSWLEFCYVNKASIQFNEDEMLSDSVLCGIHYS